MTDKMNQSASEYVAGLIERARKAQKLSTSIPRNRLTGL